MTHRKSVESLHQKRGVFPPSCWSHDMKSWGLSQYYWGVPNKVECMSNTLKDWGCTGIRQLPTHWVHIGQGLVVVPLCVAIAPGAPWHINKRPNLFSQHVSVGVSTRRRSVCYLWSDVDVGVKGFVVVFGHELVKHQVELFWELARVRSHGSEFSGAAGKLFLGVRRDPEPPTVQARRSEPLAVISPCRGGRDAATPESWRWHPACWSHVFSLTHLFV